MIYIHSIYVKTQRFLIILYFYFFRGFSHHLITLNDTPLRSFKVHMHHFIQNVMIQPYKIYHSQNWISNKSTTIGNWNVNWKTICEHYLTSCFV